MSPDSHSRHHLQHCDSLLHHDTKHCPGSAVRCEGSEGSVGIIYGLQQPSLLTPTASAGLAVSPNTGPKPARRLGHLNFGKAH